MGVRQSFFLTFHLVTLPATCHFSCPSTCFCNDESGDVRCIGDGLWNAPEYIPRNTSRLELRSYIIGSLGQNNFTGLFNLRELQLPLNQIKFIDNGTFSLLTNLERLDLSQNNLFSITEFTFLGLPNLRYLDLSSNYLVKVDKAFHHLGNVILLNLRNNKLRTLNFNTFLGMIKLEYLNLDSNYIQTIDSNSFKSLLNLAHLILSSNPLGKLDFMNFDGARLQYIDLSNCSLREVPKRLTSSVRDFRLAKNNLTIINEKDFENYIHLNLLVLDDNQITSISNRTFPRMHNLQKLWLNGNNLTSLPQGLPKSLHVLYLEENQLRKLEQGSFVGLTNLQQLLLQRNNISEIDRCTFCDLWSLQDLDLKANHLEIINEWMFKNLSKVLTLDLSQNPIHTFDSRCFRSLTSLTTLQLSRVKRAVSFSESTFDGLGSLTVLDIYNSPDISRHVLNSVRTLQSLSNLQELNIMHNNLAYLRDDFATYFPRLSVMRMSGNPWHCDRRILWICRWIRASTHIFPLGSDNRCASPYYLKDRPLILITEIDIASPDFGMSTFYTRNSAVTIGPEHHNITQIVDPLNPGYTHQQTGNNPRFNSEKTTLPRFSEGSKLNAITVQPDSVSTLFQQSTNSALTSNYDQTDKNRYKTTPALSGSFTTPSSANRGKSSSSSVPPRNTASPNLEITNNNSYRIAFTRQTTFLIGILSLIFKLVTSGLIS